MSGWGTGQHSVSNFASISVSFDETTQTGLFFMDIDVSWAEWRLPELPLRERMTASRGKKEV
jgi:hypothetical protein